jgi:hypothetical protein
MSWPPQITVLLWGYPPHDDPPHSQSRYIQAVVPPRWFWRLFPPGRPWELPLNCIARASALPPAFGQELVPGFRGFWSDEAANLLWQREHKWWRVVGRWALAGTVGLVTVVAFFTAVVFVAYLVHP